MIAIEDCVDLAGRGLEVYINGSEERLLQATRGDRVNGLEKARVLKKAKNWETARLGGESYTWSVFETN